jgi:hypothetical protein
MLQQPAALALALLLRAEVRLLRLSEAWLLLLLLVVISSNRNGLQPLPCWLLLLLLCLVCPSADITLQPFAAGQHILAVASHCCCCCCC